MSPTHNHRFATTIITTLLLLCWLNTHAQQYLFIGSYNWDKDKPGIYVYEMDTASGKLKHISTVDSLLNPAYLTLSPDGKYVYACTEAHTAGLGSVSSFAFDSKKGSLHFINKQSSNGENPVYVSVDKSGKWLVDANYTQASVSVYPLSNNGYIGTAAQVLTFKDSSINEERQEAAHIHAAVFSPQQDYIFFPDLGADKIRCYKFDAAAPQPLQPATIPFTKAKPGTGPRHFVFHPNHQFAYCVEEMAGFVSAYKYADGTLTFIQTTMIHEYKRHGGYSSADIHISPDGKFLYASNRSEENNIAIFSINQQTGQLKTVGFQSTFGNHPRIFTLTPDGKFVVVANQISGDVVVFKRNATTGLLTQTGIKMGVPGASCVVVRKY